MRYVLLLTVAAALLLAPVGAAGAVSPVSVQQTYSDWALPATDGGYWNIDTPVFPSNLPQRGPGQEGLSYFYAAQFGFSRGADPGYIGIQIDQSQRAIFSIWGATGASCSTVAGAICRPFTGEGDGWQTAVPYQWVAGHYYETRVWAVGSDADGDWWLGALLDRTPGAEAETIIGTLRVPHGRGWLSGNVSTWVEWYGPPARTCQALPISVVYFGPSRGNNGTAIAGAPSSHLGSGACPSSVSTYGEWARHRNGWGD